MFPLYKRPCLFVTATLSKTKWSGAKLWYISSFKSRPSLYSTGMCSYKVIQGHLSGINDGTRLHNNIHVNIFWFGFTRPSELHPAFIWTPSGQEEWGVGSLSEYRHSPEIAGERGRHRWENSRCTGIATLTVLLLPLNCVSSSSYIWVRKLMVGTWLVAVWAFSLRRGKSLILCCDPCSLEDNRCSKCIYIFLLCFITRLLGLSICFLPVTWTLCVDDHGRGDLLVTRTLCPFVQLQWHRMYIWPCWRSKRAGALALL